MFIQNNYLSPNLMSILKHNSEILKYQNVNFNVRAKYLLKNFKFNISVLYKIFCIVTLKIIFFL